jgi:hypothetical protein
VIDGLARGNLLGDWSICGSTAAGVKIEAEAVTALVDVVVVVDLVESKFGSAALELDFLRS